MKKVSFFLALFLIGGCGLVNNQTKPKEPNNTNVNVEVIKKVAPKRVNPKVQESLEQQKSKKLPKIQL